MSTTPHKNAPVGQIHSPVNWVFDSAAERRAAGSYTLAQRGAEAMQVDTSPATFWKLINVVSGVPVWSRADSGAESVGFAGDFGALFASFSGLTVRAYYRYDQATGTTGTGKSAIANLLGDYSAMGPASGATNGIGAVGTGLGGKASLTSDGSTQGGLYTAPSAVAVATTNFHIWEVSRFINTPSAVVNWNSWASGSADFQLLVLPAQTSPACNFTWRVGGLGMSTSSRVINQWYRIRASAVGGGANTDRLRIGNEDATPAALSNSTPSLTNGWACNGAGGNKGLQLETLVRLHVEGPLATFLTASAVADTESQSFYSSAIQI